MDRIGDGIWRAEAPAPGPSVAISFGVHGNERAPIDAGLELVAQALRGEWTLARGRLLLIHANPAASAIDQRWSEGGVDLNRCFHPDVMAREPALAEQRRAHEIADALTAAEAEVLVDFHCTVEPGDRFLMHHPSVTDAAHRDVSRWLQSEVALGDPTLQFGGVSLDEWMSTRGRVGICYETGWMGDPDNTPEQVLGEMRNVLAGLGLVGGEARSYGEKRFLELDRVVRCERAGFRWAEGVGRNLQALPAGTRLGEYEGGAPVELAADAVLIFPKKKPELVTVGAPLVYLASRRD